MRADVRGIVRSEERYPLIFFFIFFLSLLF
jgi:hypothetical protein